MSRRKGLFLLQITTCKILSRARRPQKIPSIQTTCRRSHSQVIRFCAFSKIGILFLAEANAFSENCLFYWWPRLQRMRFLAVLGRIQFCRTCSLNMGCSSKNNFFGPVFQQRSSWPCSQKICIIKSLRFALSFSKTSKSPAYQQKKRTKQFATNSAKKEQKLVNPLSLLTKEKENNDTFQTTFQTKLPGNNNTEKRPLSFEQKENLALVCFWGNLKRRYCRCRRN